MDLGSNLTLIVLQTYTTGKSRYTVVISYANNIYSRIHSSILARIVTFIVHAKQFKIMQVKFRHNSRCVQQHMVEDRDIFLSFG